jgi:hypothetical protein
MTTNFICQLNICFYSPNVTSSQMRGWVCCLQLLRALTSVVILRSKSCGTHDHILLPQIRDFPNMECQVPIFISPRNRVAWLYSQALGSLSVASYDSQGFGGGIQPHLHIGQTEYCALNICLIHQGRPKRETLTVIPKRRMRWPLPSNSGKHISAIARQQPLYYCVCI